MESTTCWLEGCQYRHNKNSYATCGKNTATDWNILGVKTMERYIANDRSTLSISDTNLLWEAYYYFKNATEVDNGCSRAAINRAIVANKLYTLMKNANRFLIDESFVLEKYGSNDPLYDLLEIVYLESKLEYTALTSKVNKFNATKPEMMKKYISILPYKQHPGHGSRVYSREAEKEAIADYLIFAEFSDVSLTDYALLFPMSQDQFLNNKYILLKNVLHPFVLGAASKCYRKSIESGSLKLGDGQAHRYVAYNDRCSRFIHYHFADLIRKVVVNNAIPSYTYFGGYTKGSYLKPHTDRNACEFTVSLSLENIPEENAWPIFVGKTPNFDLNDEFLGNGNEKLPPKDEHVKVELLAGDALLFMGRHLTHWREGELENGRTVNQIFLHYVRSSFNGELA
eukprot:TRINITY_DN10657_c0_g1_i1.p1 TRINITY_DN10657_c0_g1~~TRINITY_DN10657_c0_g1_i1.p1  ORF type:complete len:456 (-),score=71.12 TRINITY_DN10657_c0_g1_i1:31-1224(-)